MSNLAFHVFERLNGMFDPTLNSKGGNLGPEEIERRERAFFNPPQSRQESCDVDWYRLPVDGGVPRLLKHYMQSFGSLDVPLSGTNEHLLHYTMNVGQEFAHVAHHTPAGFQKGLAECARIIARNSSRILTPQQHGPTLATDAFNFVGLSPEKKHANTGARAEVVIATLYNQLFRKVKDGREMKAEPALPLFRPPVSQPDEASRDAHYQLHGLVSNSLNYPDGYASNIVRVAEKLDPEGLAFWKRVPPPPPLRPAA